MTLEIILILVAAAGVAAAAFTAYRAGGQRTAFEKERVEKDSRILALEREKAALETRIQSQEHYTEELRKIHAEALERSREQHARDMELMRDQFRTAAAEISEKNTREFREQSAGKIEDLLRPVREKFMEFTRSMDDSRTSAVKMKTSLEEQIKNLMEHSDRVSDEARGLANALTSRSKVQGDFGELILKDILMNAGLTEGLHFICQGVITDEDGHEVKGEDGRTLIPDVLVLYPDNTLVVVDSKVSLKAYAAYSSAVTDGDRDAAARQHIDSVRRHINELADKSYASYIPDGRRKVDYNIMFIPNEGAFRLMLDRAPALWQEAKDRKVLVVSQMTLVIVLNMIQMVWKQSEKEKNIEEVHKAASELMSQLNNWMADYVSLGEQIERTSRIYAESRKTLVDSQQSVIKKIRKLESLGVEPKTGRTRVKGGVRRTGSESVIPQELSSDYGEPDRTTLQNI